MADQIFFGKSVKELQKYLKDRGVIFSDFRKAELIVLCIAAQRLGIDVDPDGLVEDREEILKDKLTTPEGTILQHPEEVQGSNDLRILPPFSIFDIYNYLINFDEHDHETLREYWKMEGFQMYEDHYVLDVQSCLLNENYSGLTSKVKPRTNEKDPVSKLKYYKSWIVFSKTKEASKSGTGTIFSAYCSCKGGIDGGCRHIVATLFEIVNFLNDRTKASVTSGPCQWLRKSQPSSEPVLVTELQTSLTKGPATNTVKPTEEDFIPVPEDVDLPDPLEFVAAVKEARPDACILDAFETRKEIAQETNIRVKLPFEKTLHFWTAHLLHICSDSCYTEFLEYLQYTSEEIEEICRCTTGQRNSANWKKARHGLLTSSNFKTICHSTNPEKTASSVLEGPSFDEKNPPDAISYGIKFENKAREMFMGSHRFHHRKCKLEVPGLVVSSQEPMLATSPDGIVDCSICGKFLVEVKCLYAHRNFHLSNALTSSKLCVKLDDEFQIVKSHRYNYQIQGQMGITGIQKCILVAYTNKGISPVQVNFDENMWTEMKAQLKEFYRSHYLQELLKRNDLK